MPTSAPSHGFGRGSAGPLRQLVFQASGPLAHARGSVTQAERAVTPGTARNLLLRRHTVGLRLSAVAGVAGDEFLTVLAGGRRRLAVDVLHHRDHGAGDVL